MNLGLSSGYPGNLPLPIYQDGKGNCKSKERSLTIQHSPGQGSNSYLSIQNLVTQNKIEIAFSAYWISVNIRFNFCAVST